MKGYEEYADMMNSLYGKEVDIEARNKLRKENGITKDDFNWEGKDNEGYATVYLQHGEPVYIMWYAWNLSSDQLEKNLQEVYGENVKLSNIQGRGNGHYNASLERK